MSDPFSKPTMSVPDAGELLGLGRNAAYDAAKRGDLPTIKIGGRVMVITSKLREMMDVQARPTESTDMVDRIADIVTARVLKRLSEALR